jgi:hypothetical protein
VGGGLYRQSAPAGANLQFAKLQLIDCLLLVLRSACAILSASLTLRSFTREADWNKLPMRQTRRLAV